MTKIIDKITNKFQDFGELMKEKRKHAQVKKELLNKLTIKELEKIYINYISPNLYKEVEDFNTKKKTKIRLERREIYNKIFRKVGINEIKYIITRLK